MVAEQETSRTIPDRVARHLPTIYLAIALLVSTALCALTPPFEVPDEAAHAERAAEIAHGEIMAHKTAAGVGGMVDVNLVAIAPTMERVRVRFWLLHRAEKRPPDGRVTAAELAPMQGVRWAHRTAFAVFENTAVYSPLLYLPQAIGWRIGEAADLTIVRSLLLARLCAAWCATAIGWLALRLSKGERWLVFVFLLLPTELSLVSSCSQDALLMPIAGLVTVLLWRAVRARRMLTNVEMVVAACLIAACAAARVPYLPMSLALMVPAFEANGDRRKKLMGSAMGVALAVGLVGGWQIAVHSLGTVAGPEAHPALQVAYLRSHPLAGAVSVLYEIFVQVPVSLAKGTYLLGSNEAVPANPIRVLLLASGAGVVLLNLVAGVRSWAGRAVLTVALVGTLSAIWLAEYIIWTPPGAAHVIGLQTRYFLPLLPFVFLLCPERWAEAVRRRMELRERGWGAVLPVAAAVVFAATVTYAPWVVSHVFYRMGLLAAFSLVWGR